jgi:hypothetical protein
MADTFGPILDDQQLIKECANYAQSLAAFDAEFSGDPEGNKVENVARHADRAAAALEKIAATPAKTAKGLQAKAQIVAVVIEDAHAELQKRDEKFLLSFAADVKAFLQPIINEPSRNTIRQRARRSLWNSLARGREVLRR